jgi:hypothetical protein
MSMNLVIHAEAHIDVTLKNGEIRQKVVTEEFGTWQTPTNVTFDIIAKPTHNERVKAYKAWVLSLKDPGDDFTCDHLESLDEWLADHEGLKIEFSFI